MKSHIPFHAEWVRKYLQDRLSVSKIAEQTNWSRNTVYNALKKAGVTMRKASRAFQDPVHKFWGNIEKQGECWIWTGAKDKDGYGWIYLYGRQERAHRFSYMLHCGSIEKGVFVCHHCDTPACCNPEHLYAGTRQDNADDAINRNLYRRGEKHGRAKLTVKEVKEIRSKADDYTQNELAAEYGVSRPAISKIITRENWGHV